MQIKSVSVVIPAYNSEKTISQAIKAVLGQDFDGTIELIVVDDGSSDKTAEIVQSFPNVQSINQENQGPASARNLGAQKANGEIVFFTDSDCVPHVSWISTMLAHFSDPSIAAVRGSYGIANPESLLARCVHEEILYRHRFLPRYPKVFGSYNVGIRKRVIDEIGGFNTGYRHASGEDNDLSYRILSAGYKILFEPKALVDHYHPTSLKKYLKEQYRHGFWRVKMYFAHPHMARGDDYTFWKDIVEPPAVILFLATFSWSILAGSSGILDWTKGIGIFLVILELVFGVIIMKKLPEGLFFCIVMFLRSLVRTFGFMAGILHFSVNLPGKDRKK